LQLYLKTKKNASLLKFKIEQKNNKRFFYALKVYNDEIFFKGILMQKDDLKSLTKHIYENMLEHIDNEKNPTREHIVNFLHNAIDIVSGIDKNKIDSIEHNKETLANTYKEIAKQGLSSYKETNGRFQELSQQIYETTANHTKDRQIDLTMLTDKFNDIQTLMSDEVTKANNVISQLTQQVKTLEETSNLDSLTKVFNRRALSSYLSTLCLKNDIKHELHVLMLDIDNFKNINDRYGHIAGDKILIFIANILKKTLRDGDKIFRYGGEEFIIILNRIEKDKCMNIALRLLELVGGNNLIYKGETINVTISIGTTMFIKGDSPDSIISRADKALYKAKENGKNQMCSEWEVTDGI
jgi:diguanylate cyclase (GGDEF)-like protein